MYTLKTIVQRGSMLGAAAAISLSAVLPASMAFADGLNPLTQRSLLLSSSAPGFMDSDGAGNSESNPNAYNGGEYYAPPGSGPNGKKSGETFTFNVSTDSAADPTNKTIKAFTLQYCTKAAGKCQAPGNNSGDELTADRMDNTTAHALPTPTSDFDVVKDGTTPWTQGTGPGQFQVYVGGTESTQTWNMDVENVEDDDFIGGGLTGKNNMIVLTSTTGETPAFNDQIKIKFTPDTKNYITNPGAGSFFVKINTYNNDNGGSAAGTALLPDTSANIVDGGVTVANVMTDSIHITTKVLETMAFSVGTQNPDTQNVPHGSCQSMTPINNNRLDLGNPNAESSLETTQAYDTFSYWRLSSNSSGGATVYYSGDTLRNTVGDYIADMPVRAYSLPGTEQFGLALVDAGADAMDTLDPLGFPTNHITPNIAPLVVQTPYAGGDVASISDEVTTNNAEFAFKKTSQTIPEVIAQNTDDVISCATAKVRYVGNIAADTPAGVYTTKINYLAAPQY